MRELSNEDHERLWRACSQILSSAGARAAMLCDARTGHLLVSVGDAGARGAVQGVTAIAPGERVVHGEAGHVYGVDLPGGILLAVLHDEGKLEAVRAASAEARPDVLAVFEPPPPQPEARPQKKKDARVRRAAPKKKAKVKKPAAKKKAPAAKARASKKRRPKKR